MQVGVPTTSLLIDIHRERINEYRYEKEKGKGKEKKRRREREREKPYIFDEDKSLYRYFSNDIRE